MTAPSLRDHIARVIESVAHDPGGRPCEPCVETADAVLGDWLRLVDEHLQAHLCEPVYTRPRPEETPDA